MNKIIEGDEIVGWQGAGSRTAPIAAQTNGVTCISNSASTPVGTPPRQSCHYGARLSRHRLILTRGGFAQPFATLVWDRVRSPPDRPTIIDLATRQPLTLTEPPLRNTEIDQ